jgi:alpha-L-rhamnosidase
LSHGIEYAGSLLKPTSRYTWKVTVWDNANATASSSSWFETGLMNTDISAWSGAKWIGGGEEDLVFYSHYLSVFKFEYSLQLDKASNSTKAAFVFGGNDKRLKKKALNLMGVENGDNQSYIAFELDISNVNDSPEGLAKLHIYRVGYTPNEKADVPFKSLDISQKLINNANKYEKHKIFADCNFGLFELYIDGRENDNKLKEKSAALTGGFGARGINLNPSAAETTTSVFRCWPILGFG